MIVMIVMMMDDDDELMTVMRMLPRKVCGVLGVSLRGISVSDLE